MFHSYSQNLKIDSDYMDSKMASDSISEHLFFKIFLGGVPPDPPSISMLCMLIALHTMEHALGIHLLCFQEDNTLPPPRNPLYLILTPLDQNPERNPGIECVRRATNKI